MCSWTWCTDYWIHWQTLSVVLQTLVLPKHIFRPEHGSIRRTLFFFCSVLWVVGFLAALSTSNHTVSVFVCGSLDKGRHLRLFPCLFPLWASARVYVSANACMLFSYARFLHHLSGWMSLVLPNDWTHKHAEATAGSQLVIKALQEYVCDSVGVLSLIAIQNLSH